MSQHLLRDLERVKKAITTLGAMVEEATNKAITAFLERRSDLAEAVIAGDSKIDEKEIEVEDECLKTLALHQPVAGDLRFLITVLKVNNDLERIGDLAVNIAERSAYLAEQKPLAAPSQLRQMADSVRTMLNSCLDALVERDPAKAKEVRRMDDAVDSAHRTIWSELQDKMVADPAVAKRANHVLSAAYQLERIADHATNIAEDIIFLVEGQIVRHGPVTHEH